MQKAYLVDLDLVEEPIKNLETKFGGQPVWLTEPQWPCSKLTGKPMRFICQISLSDIPEFEHLRSKMAYIFITDDEGSAVAETWDSEAGENAVILQPGATNLPLEKLLDGPTIKKWFEPKKLNWKHKILCLGMKPQRAKRECEFKVRLTPVEEPDSFDDETNTGEAAFGTKIGGTPQFQQNAEFPVGGPWRLLLQIDSCKVPFEINFGDAGVGYIFLSGDGSCGKFLWQCL